MPGKLTVRSCMLRLTCKVVAARLTAAVPSALSVGHRGVRAGDRELEAHVCAGGPRRAQERGRAHPDGSAVPRGAGQQQCRGMPSRARAAFSSSSAKPPVAAKKPQCAQCCVIKVSLCADPLQEFLKSDHIVLADTGDCMFWTQRLKLPEGAGCARCVCALLHFLVLH